MIHPHADISLSSLEERHRTMHYFKSLDIVPASVKPGTPVPLLITLHGSSRNGLSLVEKWKELADKEGFIVVGGSGGGRFRH